MFMQCISEFLHFTSVAFSAPMIGKTTSGDKKTRTKFTKAEDELILDLVSLMGPRSWNNIANHCPNRTARQIRERYVNYLSPKVQNKPWTEEEDALLGEKVCEFGRKWSKIAKFFSNRTDVTIKNRWVKIERNKDRSRVESDPPAISSDCHQNVETPSVPGKPSPTKAVSDNNKLRLDEWILEEDLGIIETNLDDWTV